MQTGCVDLLPRLLGDAGVRRVGKTEMGYFAEASPLGAMEAFLASLEREQREPDRWESFCLMCAFAHVVGRNYKAAQKKVALAELPHELRPPTGYKAIPTTHKRMTADDLRIALEELRLEYLLRKASAPERGGERA